MTLLEYSVGESDAERLALMGWDYYGENLEESREKYFEKKQALSALVKGSESSTIDRDLIAEKLKELKKEKLACRVS
jgi:hypothetical protein